MPTTPYPSRTARIVIARMAGLRPGTSPPPVRMAIVPFPIVLSLTSDHEFVRFGVGQGLGRERERAPVSNLLRGSKEGAERGPAQCRADADPPDAEGGKLGDRKGPALQSHDDVHRLLHGRAHGPDVLRSGKPGRIQRVRPGSLEGLEPADRVVQIRAPVQKILGAPD